MKIDPEAFPNDCPEISRKITAKIAAKCEFWPPTWPLGRCRRSHFWSVFRPWGTLGSQNGPKTPPKSLWDHPGPQILMNFDGF